ncbi:2'-5' RNA ligase family protein [Chitinophaga rhizophila]|uniref:2'-5' RNA ligase family protein n=1 Tax=Chitinophaga rhizophila TaxID=2866212 RepID=A0ABS7GE28_9BACT|nr:2'-5' RNA ligase family protein [Chitinophaga rhizophila]MBW8685545.1 2'-5' RNA ligase family protein [Chitinophaga rhizophila]
MTYGRNDQPRQQQRGNGGRPDSEERHHRTQRHNQFRKSRPPKSARFPPKPKPPKVESKIYFIALLPNAAVGTEIIRLKQEFAEKYEARKALRVLPHITLQVPFTASPELEKSLGPALHTFAATLSPFEIKLNGFGGFSFTRRKVLYINVEKNEGIVHLHQQLVDFLRKDFGFSHMLARYGFNPHISLAFRDLSDQEFNMAMDEYGSRPFDAAFQVRNLYLLRHTGTSWEVLQKCRLGGE